MRTAAALAAVTAAVIAAALAGPAGAATPVLDGKKIKNLTFTQEAPRGAATTDPSDAQVVACAQPDCARIAFVYKPAKGIVAPLSVQAKSFYPVLTDLDVYLLQGSKVLGRCTGTTSNLRHMQFAPAALKRGAVYTAVMYFSHSVGETVRLDVSLPGRPAKGETNIDQGNVFDSTTTRCGT